MAQLLRHPWSLASMVLCFLALHLYAVSENFPFLIGIPIAILGALVLIYYPKQLLIFLAFATPLSFNFENLSAFGGIGFYFPTEPLLFALMLLYILKLISGYKEKKELLTHPLSQAILLNLIWIGITCITSELPVVSFKYLLSRLWFVLVMYFMINKFFADEKYIRLFLWSIIFGVIIVIFYTISVHATHGFNEEAGHWVMSPFFKDHTSYGAILALIFPLVLFHFFYADKSSIWKMLLLALVGLFLAAIVLSYTRAAWVSLVGAGGVWLLIKWRIDFKVVLLGFGILFGFYLGFEDQIVHSIESNRQDSSDNLTEHVQSITNVSSDASNLERLNRWSSALEMFYDRPIFGHGPGTYMFQYGTYQKSSDKTIISTNQGDGGNAHSEYLGPLSEQGALGSLFTLIVFIMSLVTGIKLYYRLDENPYLKGIVLSIVLGLVTYYLHGILNNFLDTDKASVPIWGMMSILVAIQIYHIPQSKDLTKSAAE